MLSDDERREWMFSIMRVLAIATVAVLLVIGGALALYAHVANSHVTPSSDTGLSYDGLKDALRAQGATLQDDGGGSGGDLTGTVHFLVVNGTKINVYEYDTTPDAERDVPRISPDGSTIISQGPFGGQHGSVIDYIKPPHWFHMGRIIVLYVGCDESLGGLLQQVLGSPFAGDVNWQTPCS